MTDRVQDFWREFQSRNSELALAIDAENPAYDALLSKLQAIDQGLFLEFTTKGDPKELVITAEGERSLFALARAVVEAAPGVEGWRVVALKPKTGFPSSVSWNGLTIEIDEIYFEPLESTAGDLGLRLLVSGIPQDRIEDAHNALLRAIDHGLGEEAFAGAIQFTEVVPVQEGTDLASFISLRDLERFVQWRAPRQ